MSTSQSLQAPKPSRAVSIWLISVWSMILAMVLVGGITRLTGSGLSMVEWHPLMGAVPPIGEAQWNEVFELYKESPQYQVVNHWMDLDSFKSIFFWEYIHRLIGRLIGVVVLVPCLYFMARKKLSRSLVWKSMFAIFLGGMQGLLGWYMVKSGLVDDPAVSHFRLAAHLMLAFLVGQWILWMWLDLRYQGQSRQIVDSATRRSMRGFLLLLLIQIVYGAFVAGLRAGHMAMTFPDMNGYYLPHHFYAEGGIWNNLLHAPLAVHYLHRLLALVALTWGIKLFLRIRGQQPDASLKLANLALLLLLVAQIGLGIYTVLSFISIPVAVAHQGTAYLLTGSVFFLLHRSKVDKLSR
ncbi:MAG: COX15/CtaA family protein [Planctomycetes bacterium]|nr:COX15/CtaA family protein [Planctomycetota bacterium]